MGFWHEIFSGLGQTFFEAVNDHDLKEIKKSREKEKDEYDEVRSEIVSCIVRNQAIPSRIKKDFPHIVAETCIQCKRPDLARDLIPAYEAFMKERKKDLAKMDKIDTAQGCLDTSQSFLNMAFVILFILVFVGTCGDD